MSAVLANAAIMGGAVLLLALPASAKRENRVWIVVLILAAVANSVVQELPETSRQWRFVYEASAWNWSGKVLGIILTLTIAAALIATRKFSARSLGLSLLQERGTGKVLLMAVVPFLCILAILTATLFGNRTPPSLDTIWFQATMPGISEEIAFRGVLLALFDRCFRGRVRFAGTQIGYGALATSVLFGLGHGVTMDNALLLHTHLVPGLSTAMIGFFLAWLRMRTRSLVLPIAVHNAINIVFVAIPRVS